MKKVLNVLGPLVTVWCTACGASVDMGEAVADEAVAAKSEALIPPDRIPVTFEVGFGRWTMDTNRNGTRDASELQVNFGSPGDLPIIGAWGGDHGCLLYDLPGAPSRPVSRLGVFRPSTNQFYLDTNGNQVWDSSDRTITVLLDKSKYTSAFPFAWRVRKSVTTCTTVVGLFTKKQGTESVWHINENNDTYLFDSDAKFSFGDFDDIPAPFAWDVDARPEVSVAAVYRSSVGTFFIDSNFSRNWNGCSVDQCVQFGINGSLPVLNGERPFIGTSDQSSFFLDSDKSRSWTYPNDEIIPFSLPPASFAMTGWF